MRRFAAVLALIVLLPVPAAATTAAPVGADAPDDRLVVYDVTADAGTDALLRAEGYDIVGSEDPPAPGRITLQMVLTGGQARALRDRGLEVRRKGSDGGPATAGPADGQRVWRPWSGPGGLAGEMEALARRFDDLTELVTIGESVLGRPIHALRVTADADRVDDGGRPAVLYLSGQHGREWIAPEVNRRLLRYVLDNYGTDERVTGLVDTTELWFVLVANPDGYDRTFEDGQRLWHKNLRDNDGDGTITTNDGVDLDRNFPSRWGYDNEGSSPDPANATYRGTGPASEPETQAIDGLLSSVDFSFLVDYHAAGERILYGVGWQVDTPTPDDVVNVALAGTDAAPAIDGYDPDLAAELSTSNGGVTDHAHSAYGALGFTVELATCRTATGYIADDEFGPTWCDDEGRSVFEFPDSERLVQAEFTKNLDFALAVAASADDPADPESPVGTPAPDFVVDTFTTSYGTPQEVAVWTRRAHRDVRMHYSIDRGPTRTAKVREWDGGERYGDGNDAWYAEYRAAVSGLSEGDTVEVWFTAVDGADARADGATLESRHFRFTVETTTAADVLVVADTSPGTQLGGAQPLEHLDRYTRALDANGYSWHVYDVGTAGPAPHPLGVLGHHDAVIWYTGDKLVTDYQGGLDTTRLAHQVGMAMRDHLNEGGKVLATGRHHGFAEFFPLDYGENGDPGRPCSSDDCLQLSNDTYQYYFGGYIRVRRDGEDADRSTLDVAGVDTPYSAVTWDLDRAGRTDGQGTPGAADAGTASWVVTSSALPVDEFPQFESWRAAVWPSASGGAFAPARGDWQVASDHHDAAYTRLTRTIDLTGASDASLRFSTSYRIEADWDHFFVEVRTVGQDDWTTLPDANGHTSQHTGESCGAGWAAQLHPHLDAYQTLRADGTCAATGTTGAWHAATGISDGVEEWSIDLSAYAGRRIEIALSYATDWSTGDLGVFVDDVSVTADGATVARTSFEEDLGGWAASGAPGSDGRAGGGDWQRVGALVEAAAAVATDDTVLLGFGFERVASAQERNELMRRTMEHLLGSR